jgi:flagellar biogenesis protein FliO
MAGFSIIGALIKVALVFGLLFVTLKIVARVNSKSMGGSGRGLASFNRPSGKTVEVVGRSVLGRNASVVVVRVGTSCLALGVSENAVNLLSEVEVDLEEPAPPAGTQVVAAMPTWRDFLENLRERTVRR